MDPYSRFHPPIYPPLQAAAHRVRRFVPTPRAPHTMALTSGPRSHSSIGTGRQNGGAAALNEIPTHPGCTVSHLFVMMASGPVIPAKE
jgi:hypothetical protein